QQLIQIASEIPLIEVCYYAEISEQWRFSSQEKRQLKSLLSKRAVLRHDKALDLSEWEDSSGKQVLKYLRNEMSAQAFGGF
ncbi:MAG: hypothetical protein GQ582_01410, partial [Methyloprofundus sp.]|nr:hypothetical protein [Methyloprofundus sp.]